MARKKRNWFTQTFGRHFGIWDLLLVLLFFSYPLYSFIKNGTIPLLEEIGSAIFGATIVAMILNVYAKIKKKAKK